MNAIECLREEDVLEAVICGRWPEGLRAHAEECPSCGDLAIVADVLRRDREDLGREAQLPTPGQIWWRATMRRRAEAAAAAARPITLVQGLAGACAAGLLGALVTATWPSFQSAFQEPLAWTTETLSRQGERIGDIARSVTMMQQELLTVAVILGAGLILMPFVLFLVLSED